MKAVIHERGRRTRPGSLSGYLLPAAAPIVASLDRNAEVPLAAAFVALAAWLTLLVGAGLWRTLNDEY